MEINKYADIFKTLSDTNRIKILSIINSEGDTCACKLLEHFKITQPTLAYHMKMLIDAELVTCYKKGTWCVYRINKEQFINIKNFINEFNTNTENVK